MRLPLIEASLRALLALILTARLGAAAAAPSVPGELLVGFKEEPRAPAAKADPRDLLHAKLGTQRALRLEALNVDQVTLPPDADLETIRGAYASDVSVAFAEPNYLFHALSFPADALYVGGLQPWYDAIGAAAAYNSYTSGSPAFALPNQVTLAVLDTGVTAHPQFASVLLPGASFKGGEPTTDDLQGHGSFVSGLIASNVTPSAEAGSGIAGVFFDQTKIRILPVKVLGASGNGSTSEIAAGIIWAADQGARVFNMSLGSIADSATMESAINYARGRSAFIVAAAGNDNAPVGYPAAYPNVFSVAALDHNSGKASYSSYGRVDLSAPGGDGDNSCACGGSVGCGFEIWSTCNSTSPTDYKAGAGTSFAAPQVAAAAALLLSQDSTRSASDLHRILVQSADALGGGYSPYTGWGRLNVYKALTYGNGPASVPGTALKIYNWPNPFNPDREGFTNFTFMLEHAAAATLRVLDLSGDLVLEKKLDASRTFAGMNLITWDGRNGAGQGVANGVYFVVLESEGKVAKNRAVVLR